MNYTDARVPFTRVIEHKHFTGVKTPTTIITKEYPQKWEKGKGRYYPIEDEKNKALYQKYKELADILETDVNKVQEALGTNGKKVSVDAPFQDDDSNSLIDIMTDESAPGTDNLMEKESLSSDLEAALSRLGEREAQVLKMLCL